MITSNSPAWNRACLLAGLALPLTAVEVATEDDLSLALGAEATAIAQVPSGTDADRGAGSLSADLVAEIDLGPDGFFFFDLEAGYGAGLDAEVATLQGLNGDAIGDADFAIAELWYGREFGQWYIQVGHIDLTDQFDTNAYANDENSQFLSPALINGIPVIRNVETGPGLELWYQQDEDLRMGLGLVDGGDVDESGEFTGPGWDEIFHTVYAIAEVDWSVDWIHGGTWRAYAWYHSLSETGLDGSDDEHGYGIGVSIDQTLSEHIGGFLRLNYGNDAVNEVALHASLGAQLAGASFGREQDAVGLGLSYAGLSSEVAGDDEALLETYYATALNEHLLVGGNIQYVINRAGGTDDVVTVGLRASAAF